MEQQVITDVTKKEEYGNKVEKCRLGKAQLERDLLLVEMLKEEGNYVIKGGDHMTEASIYGCTRGI